MPNGGVCEKKILILISTYPEGRLVNLDDENAVLLKIDNLVAKSESELLALDRLVHVITREGPAETSDGAGKHALHGLLGDRSGILGLLDGHGRRTRDIADNDGRADATRAIRLDPIKRCKLASGKSLVNSRWLTRRGW